MNLHQSITSCFNYLMNCFNVDSMAFHRRTDETIKTVCHVKDHLPCKISYY